MLSFFVSILAVLPLQPPDQKPPAQAEPSPRPISWELRFDFVDPRRIEVDDPATGRREVYWYMLYTVTNPSGATQWFHPTFQLVTDDLKVIDTDMGISPLVFDAIRQRHKLTHKYLVSPTQAIGELRTGSDNARESVAIWRATDLNVTAFTIFVAGLSGEARLVRNPTSPAPRHRPAAPEGQARQETEDTASGQSTADEAPHTESPAQAGQTQPQPHARNQAMTAPASSASAAPRFFTLRKTLEIRYRLPGSTVAREELAPTREFVHWVMR
jgi:hypothetical protein